MGEALTVRALRSAVLISLLLLGGCRPEGPQRPLFKLLTPAQTGVRFANTITSSFPLNAPTAPYVYNGGGVAIGEMDNDGLPDIFFTGNMVSSRLYVNKGNMRFEDITQPAGVTTNRCATGATMVDINNDGYLDIYVSVSGPSWSKPEERANLLFINNGDHTFTEAAARYGIADTSFTTPAVFLYYTGDGYLDLFLLNNSPDDFTRGEEARPAGISGGNPRSYNELYRNNGDGTFTNVSGEAGILREFGYGLGVVVSDIDGDGWPDIYVSNDITPNDVLYVNNRDGTFTDKAARWLKHTSFAGIGVDIADFNNDGRPDILQVDMMPAALNKRKRMSGNLTYGGQMKLRSRGFHAAYDVNSLQLNKGVTNDGDVVFSEIGRLAGVAYTDWSWSALFADFDNDGYKDIFVTNGYPKAVNDFDYQTAVFRARQVGDTQLALKHLKELHSYEVPNYVFRNEGDLTFTDRTKEWGMGQSGFSYGAAYADLNNDGKLDLVVNNIDAPAFIYENVQPKDDAHHYLQIKLEGESPNRRGIGSKLILTAGGQKQYLYHSPYRGYMSTMDDRAHFGLGRATRADSLEVTWPDGRRQLLTDLNVDRTLVLEQREAAKNGATSRTSTNLHQPPPTFQQTRALKYRHQPGMLVDYSVQPLLPYQPSSQGPPVAVGDVNGDGLDDVFIGGAAGVPGKLFVQGKDGSFVESTHGQPWAADRQFEDWGALFFDANGDGRPDLYVASCGYQLAPGSRWLQDRLYINQGGGRFVRDTQALPNMPTCTAAVAAGDFTASMGLPPMRGWWYSLASDDFNHDGHPDLVAGNLGLNYTYTTSEKGKFGVYAADFTGNQMTDVVLTQELDGTEYPLFGLAPLGRDIYPLAVRFPSYAAFSQASVPQLFGAAQLQRAIHYQTDTFASLYLQNNGNGTFTARPLPKLAQISPIRGIIAHDVDGDGNLDLIVAGNLYDAEPNTPAADAGNGLWVRGDGQGHFTSVAPVESGFLAPRDVTGLGLIHTPAGSAVLVANNGDSLQAFVIRRP